MSIEDQIARLQAHNHRCGERIRRQRAEIRRLRAKLGESREALESLLRDLETIPRTIDGVFARPGIEVYGDWGTGSIYKIGGSPERGYVAEISYADGRTGLALLSKCWSMPF